MTSKNRMEQLVISERASNAWPGPGLNDPSSLAERGATGAAAEATPSDDGGEEPSQKKMKLQNDNKGVWRGRGSQEGQDLSSSSESEKPSSPPDDEFINYETRTFFLHPYKPYHKLAVQYFNQDNVSEEARNVVERGNGEDDGSFYRWAGDVKGENRDEFPLDKFLVWLNGGAAKSIVQSYVAAKGNEEAQLIIIFGTMSFDRLLDKWNCEEFGERWKEGMEVIWGKISGGPDVITGFSIGLIGNGAGSTGVPNSLELENQELPCLSGLVIPKVAGLGIKTFVVTMEENSRLESELRDMAKEKKEIDLQKCKEILGITEEIEGKLKGIVLFHTVVNEYTTSYRTAPVVTVIHTYLKSNRHVPMAGGLQPTLLCRGTDDEDVLACGFLVFGEDDRLRVNCAVLVEKCMPTSNIMKLEKLKGNLLTTENKKLEVSSFCLMFGFNERGSAMHGRCGVETGWFNKILPKTRLVGTFDYGGFYREILDCNGKGQKRSAPDQIHDIYFSTFFVVSYVHPKS